MDSVDGVGEEGDDATGGGRGPTVVWGALVEAAGVPGEDGAPGGCDTEVARVPQERAVGKEKQAVAGVADQGGEIALHGCGGVRRVQTSGGGSAQRNNPEFKTQIYRGVFIVCATGIARNRGVMCAVQSAV